jgi:hypothetical protein
LLDAMLAQQTVNTNPARAMLRRCQVPHQAAPGISPF